MTSNSWRKQETQAQEESKLIKFVFKRERKKYALLCRTLILCALYSAPSIVLMIEMELSLPFFLTHTYTHNDASSSCVCV